MGVNSGYKLLFTLKGSPLAVGEFFADAGTRVGAGVFFHDFLTYQYAKDIQVDEAILSMKSGPALLRLRFPFLRNHSLSRRHAPP